MEAQTPSSLIVSKLVKGLSMMQLWVLPLPPEWNAGSLQGYPPPPSPPNLIIRLPWQLASTHWYFWGIRKDFIILQQPTWSKVICQHFSHIYIIYHARGKITECLLAKRAGILFLITRTLLVIKRAWLLMSLFAVCSNNFLIASYLNEVV